jgi:hypothetical protein
MVIFTFISCSKEVLVRAPDINLSLFDVLQDGETNRIFLYDRYGTFLIYDYKKMELIDSIQIDKSVGYCSTGLYNGSKELYIPTNDSCILIYDLINLTQIDKFRLPYRPISVAYSDNKIFISIEDDNCSGCVENPLLIIDRKTKNIINSTGDEESTRLKIIPNSNSELIEITLNLGPPEMTNYKISETGEVLNKFSDNYYGDHPKDARIFKVFPDGGFLITGSAGAIYDKSLKYQGQFTSRWDSTFWDFEVSNENSFIYGAYYGKKVVYKFSVENYKSVGKYVTNGFPFFIFMDRNDNENLYLITGETAWKPSKQKLQIKKIKI